MNAFDSKVEAMVENAIYRRTLALACLFEGCMGVRCVQLLMFVPGLWCALSDEDVPIDNFRRSLAIQAFTFYPIISVFRRVLEKRNVRYLDAIYCLGSAVRFWTVFAVRRNDVHGLLMAVLQFNLPQLVAVF